MQRSTLETAAAKYSYLRGLLAVPVGALLVVSALGNWEVGPFRHAAVFLGAVLVCAAACALIARYYNEHYGRLSPSTAQQLRAGLAVAVGLALMIGGSLLLRSRADWSLDLPVNAVAVSFALLMLVSYALGIGLKPHHAIIWGALLVTGAVPAWNGADPANVGVVLAGVALIANGVCDHRLFVRTFGPADVGALAGGDARA